MVNAFRSGRGATSIARIQKISRQTVYDLIEKHKRFGIDAYRLKTIGRPPQNINNVFVEKVVAIRNSDDYGSEKIHFVLKRDGFTVSRRQIQKILDFKGLTEPCEKRRGQRKYVRFCWLLSNYMWHCDWSEYENKWYCVFIDDCSRKIMAAGKFDDATTENALFLLYQAILTHKLSPVVVLSDKGSQFYANKYDKKGKKGISKFEKELEELGIELWTSRTHHPQTNGKMERWFSTLKQRKKRHPEENLQDFVKWYNEKRIHHALQYATPEEIYWSKM